jgi:predicted transport protein
VIQPKAGRLDLLLRDPGSNQRFEVEIQLGRTDETHIIRTLEYWDIERKRYPQLEHTAVIVAEDITSRFLNVVSLFNGFIPIIAIQVAALRVGEHLVLQFTKVLDQVQLGAVDEDLDVQQPATRSYWEERSSKDVLALVDDLHSKIKALDPSFELKYNKHFIGLARDGKPDNFVVFQPRKQWLRLGLSLSQTEEHSAALEQAGLKNEFDSRWRRYVLTVEPGDLHEAGTSLQQILATALQEWG